MKNRFQSFSFAIALGVILGLISWGGSLQAQQTPPQSQQSMPDAQQPSQAQPPTSDQTGQQTQTPETQPSGQSAQPPAAQPPSGQSTQPPDSQAQSSDAAGTQTFTGTIVKQGDKYVLQDAASGTNYDIDHQDEVKKFEGKKVRVHGTLDSTGKMIHVQ